MKYSSTTIAAAALLISSEAYADPVERKLGRKAGRNVKRNRKVKIYSSAPLLRKKVKDDVVDPFLAFPDDREQGVIDKQCMSMSSTIGSVATVIEISMPVTVGSVPVTIGSLPTAPAQDEVVDPFLALPDEQGQGGLQELSMPSSTGSVATTIGSVSTTIGSLPLTLLEMSMPATVGSVPAQSFSFPTVQSGAMEGMAGDESEEDKGRIRKSSLRKSAKDHAVDPFLGLPDEQGQGGLQELSMPSSIGSVATVLEMSMPTTIGSVPITIGSVPVTIVSAPTTIGSMPVRRRK